MTELDAELDRAIKDAEDRVQRVLLRLEMDLAAHQMQVESISVDTRNFANLAVEITVEKGRTRF